LIKLTNFIPVRTALPFEWKGTEMAYNEKIYKDYRKKQEMAAGRYENAKREMRKAKNDIKNLEKDLKYNYSFEKSKSFGASREKIAERLGKNEKLMKQYHKEARKWEKLAEAEQRKKAGNEKMAENSLESFVSKIKEMTGIKKKPKAKGR
jgi:hypothetical protein